MFGIDVAAAFDLSEKAGLVSTLANPNLTTVSGETAEFLAGGSFPVVTSSNNGTSVEYKNYGVNLTYTPTVLSDGRIRDQPLLAADIEFDQRNTLGLKLQRPAGELAADFVADFGQAFAGDNAGVRHGVKGR